MKRLSLLTAMMLIIAPLFSQAEVTLRGYTYMAVTAPDDFILQGGYSEYGDRYTVRDAIQTRAQQYCSYNNRNAQLVDYRVSRYQATGTLVMIDFGWVVKRVSSDLTRPFRDQGITGVARGFERITCR